jgi:hypothetical protein
MVPAVRQFPPMTLRLQFRRARHHNPVMADLVYLSIWLQDFNPENMLEHWRRAMEAFPVSEIAPGVSLSIYPFDWSETPVLERSFGVETDAEELAQLSSEFLHDDYAYEAEMRWDLWLPANGEAASGGPDGGRMQEELDEGGEDLGEEDKDVELAGDTQWRRAPSAVALACLGPGFAPEESEDRAHIRICFGIDAPFLPMDEEDAEASGIDTDEADVRGRENLQQLVEFVHRLDEILPVSRRLLWCESGENLAQKIMNAWHLRL